MTHKEPHISRSSLQPTDCTVARMSQGSTGTVVFGPLDNEAMYSIQKPSILHTPTGPRCRLRLLERMNDASIASDPASPCNWCGAMLRRQNPQDEE